MALHSCSKVPGCTDTNAVNYNPDAEEDDGGCAYQGGVVFWHNEATSNNLVAAGISQIEFYVNGSFADQVPANVYWSSAPDCQDDVAYTVENYGLGFSMSETFNYVIRDQDDNVLETGTYEIVGNTCTVEEFVY